MISVDVQRSTQGARDEASREAAAPDRSALPRRVLRPQVKVLPEHARGHNRSLVLQTLYRDGQLSRADIARQTGLTRVTVSDLVAELIGEQLVLEIGQREGSRPGKPATMLDLNRRGFNIIGIDLGEHDAFRGAVLDLDGTILHRAERQIEQSTGADAIAKVLELSRELVAAARQPVLGVGVGAPGVVDLDGRVLTSANFAWQGVQLRELLDEATGLPVLVGNDANVAALAEYGFGEATGDTMLIKIGIGMGAGLILGGQLLNGSQFAAGEIGQVMVGTDAGLDVPYNREACLEAWVAVPRLKTRMAAAAAAGIPEQTVLREAGQRLGVALAPVIGALNLSEVVLSGPDELYDGVLLEATVETLRNRTMADTHGSLTVRMTSLGQDIVLLGAAVMVLSGQLGVS